MSFGKVAVVEAQVWLPMESDDWKCVGKRVNSALTPRLDYNMTTRCHSWCSARHSRGKAYEWNFRWNNQTKWMLLAAVHSPRHWRFQSDDFLMVVLLAIYNAIKKTSRNGGMNGDAQRVLMGRRMHETRNTRRFKAFLTLREDNNNKERPRRRDRNHRSRFCRGCWGSVCQCCVCPRCSFLRAERGFRGSGRSVRACRCCLVVSFHHWKYPLSFMN